MQTASAWTNGAETATQSWIQGRLGSYVGLNHRITRHLASGGMAQVFLAEHVGTGRSAAVKFLTPDSDVPRELLAHEAAVLEAVRHPGIVRLIETGRACDGHDYLLLEHVNGIDLEEWLQRSRARLPSASLLALVGQLARAVDHIHAQGFVHSDIKPANVMFDAHARESVKLVDFGLAFDVRDACFRRGSAGTPGYMAPEQLRGEVCGPAIDRFGVAALTFELLTGTALQPWATLSRVRARARVRSSPLDQRDLLPKALQEVFARALHDRAEARYPSAGEFVEALSHGLELSLWAGHDALRPTEF